jgi:hypothetical protein
MGKNQHYIPQFLLRNFSDDNSKKCLTLYLIRDNKIVQNTSIKDQASKNFIYGKDQVIENIFQNIETNTSIIIDKMLNNVALIDTEKETLKTFIHFQMNRTPFNAENNNGLANLVFQTMYYNHPVFGKYVNELEIRLKNPYILSIISSIKTSKLLSDLKIEVLETNNKIPFILGQRPAYIMNPYLNEKKINYWSQGIVVKGICIFMPISFNKMIIIYDKWCYSLLKSGGAIHLDDEAINTFNTYQFFYTSDCVYIKRDMDIAYLKTLADKTDYYRQKNILDFSMVKNNKERLLYYQTKIPEIEPNLSFLKIKSQAFCENIVPTKESLVRYSILPELVKIESEDKNSI